MKILSIVVSYNGEKYIQKCFESLSLSSIKLDIFCIDNNSSDSSKKIINDNFPFVEIFESKQNIGFGQANNIGLKYALDNGYDFAFLLNQDAYISEKTVENLINTSKRYSEYGVLSPIHLNGQGSRLDLSFSLYIAEKYCPNLISDFLLKNRSKEVYSLRFVNAAAWLLPIETLRKIGGFDPLFFHYGEDDNYCQRVLFHGLKIGLVPDSRVLHDRKQIFENKDRYENIKRFERSILIRCGDLNIPLNSPLKWELKELKRRILISFISFNVRGFFKWIKFYSHLRFLIPQIEKSRHLNKIKGPNYLNA